MKRLYCYSLSLPEGFADIGHYFSEAVNYLDYQRLTSKTKEIFGWINFFCGRIPGGRNLILPLHTAPFFHLFPDYSSIFVSL